MVKIIAIGAAAVAGLVFVDRTTENLKTVGALAVGGLAIFVAAKALKWI